MVDNLEPEILKILCDYAMEGLRIRQKETPHLVMENIAPEMLCKVIQSYQAGLVPAIMAGLSRLPVEERL